MHRQRIHNFNPGPAALPLEVLREIRDAFLNYDGSGMAVVEMSHRSPGFEAILEDAKARLQRMLGLTERHRVLFLQGGASLQFAMVPMNFIKSGQRAAYVDTGTWSTKAIAEARHLGKSVDVAASSEACGFRCIPSAVSVPPEAVYLHLTSNNTIKGTQWHRFPDTGGVPLVADMSSDILSRPFDPTPFGMIYAGAQKNLGPAGVCLAIVRDDMLARVPDDLPSMLRYTTHAAKNSLYNTPPCFAIYVVQQVLRWLEETVGGLDAMAARNARKAATFYEVIDAGEFYRGTADPASRSQMNVTFRLPTPELEQRFIAEADANGFGGLKGHRSVGGCRASIYNAVEPAAVEALADFMRTFERLAG